MTIQIIGLILSGLISLTIAHFYYKKASKDLKMETENLQNLNKDLRSHLQELDDIIVEIYNGEQLIKNHVTRGTPHDPEFPYK